MEKVDTLIRTKLRQPFNSQKLVFRPRLQTRIAEGLRLNPLTLVIAPAGFGKTTLVTASLADCEARTAWFSIDRDDDQVGRFLAYLIAAMQNADHRIGRDAAQIITGIHQVLPETVLTSLINDLDSINQEMILVLDDFQYIANRDVLSAVAFLLDHCPQCFHLLIATRSDPLLPLSRLRARGQMVELRAVDLRFSEDEAIQFLNNVMNLKLERSAVAILEERTEGWIAGLQLAALSMRDREDVHGFIDGFSGTNRHILDFLMEEIMAAQSPEIQHFLLYTSILDRLTAPLCDAVLSHDEQSLPDIEGRKGGREISQLVQATSALNYLERENIFLVSLDDERIWFRYHHLFADLLRARLLQTEPGMVTLLHIRASAWLEHYGFIPEAIDHLLAVREYEQAADLIERSGPDRLAKSDPSVFHKADRLPRHMLITRPKIGLYHAWLKIIQGHIEEALPLLAGIAQHLASTNLKTEQQWMKTVVSTATAFLAPPSADPNEHPLPDESLLEDIPAEELILRNATDFLYGMALARKGQLERAIEISLKCIAREKVPQGDTAIPTLASFVTRIHLIIGRLHACANLCHEYLDSIKESSIRFVYTSGSMKIDLGEVAYEWNHLDEAEAYIRDGLAGNQLWQNIMTDGFGLTALVRVHLAKGDYPGALQVVEQLESTFRNRSLPREFEEDFHTLRVRVQLASGDLPSAAEWSDQIQHSIDYTGHQWRYQLTLAHIALAERRYEDVGQNLAGSTLTVSSRSRISRQIECYLLQAAALHGLQHQSQAVEILKTCLALAEPEGYIRCFIDGGKPTQALLSDYLKSNNPEHKRFAHKILYAFPASASESSIKSAQDGLVEPLTDRELEVLALMALGQTNQAIAHRLIVARGTIKAHAANIYRKLDVVNRTEAVSRARQLGIIS